MPAKLEGCLEVVLKSSPNCSLKGIPGLFWKTRFLIQSCMCPKCVYQPPNSWHWLGNWEHFSI